MSEILALKAAIQKASTVFLFWHINPDVDCVGSCAALKNILERQGKIVTIFSECILPEHLKFFNVDYEIFDSTKEYANSDINICVDCGNLLRAGTVGKLFSKNSVTANIDHHDTNPKFADINIVDSKAVATAEIIFKIVNKWGFTVSKEAASNLYAAIMSDSRSFRASGVTAKTFEICAKLMKFGIDIFSVAGYLFASVDEANMRVKAQAISEMKLYNDKKIVVAVISNDMLKQYGLSNDADHSGFAMELAGIKGVQVAVLLSQHNEKIRGELRSLRDFDVSKIAIALGGGGHKSASGFTMNGTIENVKDAVVKVAEKELLKI